MLSDLCSLPSAANSFAETYLRISGLKSVAWRTKLAPT
jgi:hypothetical protein